MQFQSSPKSTPRKFFLERFLYPSYLVETQQPVQKQSLGETSTKMNQADNKKELLITTSTSMPILKTTKTSLEPLKSTQSSKQRNTAAGLDSGPTSLYSKTNFCFWT